MKKVILCSNPQRDSGLECAKRYKSLLNERHIDSYICPVPYSGNSLQESGITISETENVLPGADMAVAFGGDGTILHVARAASPLGIPVLGINLGRKGFTAELEADETDKFTSLLNGELPISERMIITATLIRSGETVFECYAVNDIVISGGSRMIDLNILADGKHMMSFSGDGIIAATPTGSTAYSMSAGGPIVEPTVENIIITPICAHSLSAKAFILRGDSIINVSPENLGTKKATLSPDGENAVDLRSDDIIVIRKSDFKAKFIRISNKSFYEKVSEKLGEIR